MSIRARLFICAATFVSVPLTSAETRPVSASEKVLTIADLDWLAGCWRRESGTKATQECWTASGGGMLLGVHRDIRGERASFEFLRIAESDGEIIYFASPGGRYPATPFRLLEHQDRRVVFENPEHDFPQRIIYWLDDGGALNARVEAEVGGESKALEWNWPPAPTTAKPW